MKWLYNIVFHGKRYKKTTKTITSKNGILNKTVCDMKKETKKNQA